jgi:predicted amidohydrolase YtcJ
MAVKAVQLRERFRKSHRLIFLAAAACTAALSARALPSSDTIVGTVYCVFAPASVAPSAIFPPPSQLEPVDLLLLNGNIYTGDPAHPRAEAVAVKGDRIAAVGTSADLRAYRGPRTQVVDLVGSFAMPGFNDAHVHLASAGQGKLAVQLEGAASIEEFQQRIRNRLADFKPGEWITGRGWDHTLWPTRKFPSRQDLDAVSTEHPMFFGRVDGHIAVVNSLALRLAGITRDTKDPPGSSLERDADGEPTGILKEGAAQSLVNREIPPLSAGQRRHGIELALEEVARRGVTSLQDNSSVEDFFVYQQLRAEGKLTARITEWLPFEAPLSQLEAMRSPGGASDLMLHTGVLKGFVDGALGARTAALLAPYADDLSTSGILIIPGDQLAQMVIERDKAGFQIALHAIGDRANRLALDAFAAARAANGSRDSRHRIEHAQVLALEDIPRFAQFGVIASMQPRHETTDMRWAEARLGPARSRGAYAWNSLRKHNARLAFGTDYPVEPVNPMLGLYACVTRALPDGGPAWMPQESITAEECIAAYTQGSAYAEFAEKDKGRIVTGQLADMIVLSADPTRVTPADVLKIEVRKTFLGGRQVYPPVPAVK